MGVVLIGEITKLFRRRQIVIPGRFSKSVGVSHSVYRSLFNHFTSQIFINQ